MKTVKVLLKTTRSFQGDVEVKATAFIDYTKGAYQGDLNKHYGAGRCNLNKKYPIPYAKLQKIAAQKGLFNQFAEKGELQISCDATFYTGVNKDTAELTHWVRINLGTKENPYERNFYISGDILETIEALGVKVSFTQYQYDADKQDEEDSEIEENDEE